MRYFSNKFSKIDKSWGGGPQPLLTFGIGNLSCVIWPNCGILSVSTDYDEIQL